MRQDLKDNKTSRIGEIGYNNALKDKMKIVEYENALNITVQFENGYLTKSTYQQFKNGEVRNPYNKTIYGVGYLGVGEYKTKINKKKTRQYIRWISMFQRCYDKKFHLKCPTYKECTVCEEWHNFQNFGKWYDENYYEIGKEVMCLDKDILYKGNKIYSPNTCVFVPKNINALFTKHDSKRGNCPIGVYFLKDRLLYRSQCSDVEETYLGDFYTSEEAFNKYKQYKEEVTKEIADSYKDKIPKKLYEALYVYEVEITD